MSKVLWVMDMIAQAKKNIAESKDDSNGSESSDPSKGDTDNEPPIGATDDYYGSGNEHISPGKLLFYFGVQVVIIALVYSTIWFFCVARAVRFRYAVESARPGGRPNESIFSF